MLFIINLVLTAVTYFVIVNVTTLVTMLILLILFLRPWASLRSTQEVNHVESSAISEMSFFLRSYIDVGISLFFKSPYHETEIIRQLSHKIRYTLCMWTYTFKVYRRMRLKVAKRTSESKANNFLYMYVLKILSLQPCVNVSLVYFIYLHL